MLSLQWLDIVGDNDLQIDKQLIGGIRPVHTVKLHRDSFEP